MTFASVILSCIKLSLDYNLDLHCYVLVDSKQHAFGRNA